MSTTKRRYPKEEFARRGDEVYDKIRRQVEPKNKGKFCAVDIETGEYEIADDELEACDKLYARIPNAQPWLVRIGFRYVHRFGGRDKQESS
jgi:hypothetical protein